MLRLNRRTFWHARTQFGFFRRNRPFFFERRDQPCSAGVELAGVVAGDAGDRADERDADGGEERAEGRAGDDQAGAGDRADERDAVSVAEERVEGRAGDDWAGAAADDVEDCADERRFLRTVL